MKKLYYVITILFCFFLLSVTASAIEPLPEDEIAYYKQCNLCDKKVGTDKAPVLNSNGNYGECPYYYYNDDGSGYSCDGVYDIAGYCAKEYHYNFECSCGRSCEYDEMPESDKGYEYGVCPWCGIPKKEDMFSIGYIYRLYYKPCYYCYSVQVGPKYVQEYKNCPDCGESYDMALPASVDDKGNLIYGGGGEYLYFCTSNKQFYELTGYDSGECDLCNKHEAKSVTVIYQAKCPNCGEIAEREYIDEFKKPHIADTLNNSFGSIAIEFYGNGITTDMLRSLDYTDTCYECGYKFSEDEKIIITRYINAPKNAEYESHPNDGNFRDTEYYLEYGSEYDNFFQRIIWFFKKLFSF